MIEDVPAEPDSVEHVAGEIDVPDGYTVLEGTPSGHRRSVAIVVARFNGGITNRMLASAIDTLEHAGVAADAVTIMPVPGAFELPLAAMALAKTRRYACVVALGAIVRGETPHFDFVAVRGRLRPAARGDRDRRPGRLRRAHRGDASSRPRRGSTAPARRSGPRSRWPTSSPNSGQAPGHRTRPGSTGLRNVLCRYTGRPMSKVCSVCGKGPGFGNNRSHSMVATNRRFDPNLQRVRMMVNGVARRAYVCTRCLKGGKVQKAV